MDEIQAAVLNVKLNYLEEENRRRKTIATVYHETIKHPQVRLTDDRERDNVYHIFPVFCPSRDRLQQYLKDKGIGTMIHYPIPPHRQQAYQEWNGLHYPVTEALHRQELSLPCNPAMTDEDCRKVVDCINEFG